MKIPESFSANISQKYKKKPKNKNKEKKKKTTSTPNLLPLKILFRLLLIRVEM